MALGAEGQRALQALGARLAGPHRLDGAGVGGGDREQAARAAADDEQAVAGAQPAALEGAQHAGQRLDEGGALSVEAVEDEQLVDEVGRHADPLGEAAGVEARGLEALAQRLVAAAAAPALAARRVVVHDDAIAHGDALDVVADRELVAEDGRHLARDPRVEDVRAADAARQHAADDVAPARLGVRRLLDAHLARGQRARDPHANRAPMDAASGGRATPRSVTSAVMSAAGVTSKAGLRTPVAGSVVSVPA